MSDATNVLTDEGCDAIIRATLPPNEVEWICDDDRALVRAGYRAALSKPSVAVGEGWNLAIEAAAKECEDHATRLATASAVLRNVALAHREAQSAGARTNCQQPGNCKAARPESECWATCGGLSPSLRGAA